MKVQTVTDFTTVPSYFNSRMLVPSFYLVLLINHTFLRVFDCSSTQSQGWFQAWMMSEKKKKKEVCNICMTLKSCNWYLMLSLLYHIEWFQRRMNLNVYNPGSCRFTSFHSWGKWDMRVPLIYCISLLSNLIICNIKYNYTSIHSVLH